MSKPRKRRHVQENFRDMVVAATKANTKDYIQSQMLQVSKALARNLADQFAPYDLYMDMITDVLIEKLDETEDSLEQRLADKEDKILGLTKSDEPAKAGDHVRFKVKDLADKDAKFKRLMVKQLASEKPEIHKDFEEALIGLTTGDSKTVTVKIEDKDYTYEVKVIRVCNPKEEATEELTDTSTTTQETAQETTTEETTEETQVTETTVNP